MLFETLEEQITKVPISKDNLIPRYEMILVAGLGKDKAGCARYTHVLIDTGADINLESSRTTKLQVTLIFF